MINKIYTIYVLKDQAGKLYKGITCDIERRLFQHNAGLSGWTKKRGPFEIVYTEEYKIKSEALKREKFLKTGKGRDFLKEVLRKNFGA